MVGVENGENIAKKCSNITITNKMKIQILKHLNA